MLLPQINIASCVCNRCTKPLGEAKAFWDAPEPMGRWGYWCDACGTMLHISARRVGSYWRVVTPTVGERSNKPIEKIVVDTPPG